MPNIDRKSHPHPLRSLGKPNRHQNEANEGTILDLRCGST